MRWFVDRDEGLLWCERCVPAEVILIAKEFRETRKNGLRQDRFVEARIANVNGGTTIALRCSECAVVER